MNKQQQMRWNRATVQSFLNVRTTVLNDNLADDFRHRYSGFRPTNDDQVRSEGRLTHRGRDAPLLSAPRTDPYVRLARIRLLPRVFDGEANVWPRV